MARVQKEDKTTEKRAQSHALSDEARENQLIAMAYDAVEERIKNGTATSQELVHFLRIGTRKDRLEREILELNKELVKAKTEALQSQKRIEELVTDAMEAFKLYSGYDE